MIVAIFNRYTDILNDIIDRSDSESIDLAKLVDKRFYNASRSKSSLASLLKRDYLNKDISDRLS